MWLFVFSISPDKLEVGLSHRNRTWIVPHNARRQHWKWNIPWSSDPARELWTLLTLLLLAAVNFSHGNGQKQEGRMLRYANTFITAWVRRHNWKEISEVFRDLLSKLYSGYSLFVKRPRFEVESAAVNTLAQTLLSYSSQSRSRIESKIHLQPKKQENG